METTEQLEMFADFYNKKYINYANPQIIEMVSKLLKQKLTIYAIFKKTGFNYPRIQRILKFIPDNLKTHLKKKNKINESAADEAVHEYLNTKTTVGEILKKHSLSRTTLYKRLKTKKVSPNKINRGAFLEKHNENDPQNKKSENACVPDSVSQNLEQRMHCLEMQLEILVDEIKKLQEKK